MQEFGVNIVGVDPTLVSPAAIRIVRSAALDPLPSVAFANQMSFVSLFADIDAKDLGTFQIRSRANLREYLDGNF